MQSNTKLGLLALAVQAVIAVLVLLGWVNLTADQAAGILVAFNAVVAAVYAWFDPAIPVGNKPT
jgi:hypothetical protein